MKRRDFLKQSSASLPLLLFSPLAFSRTVIPSSQKKILILIELKGGNDGLNTLVPYSQKGYYQLRPSLALPKNSLITLPQSSNLGLHPELKHLAWLISNRQCAVLQGVGYPNPSLSHFRSMDIWYSAKPEEEVALEGWLKALITHKNHQALSFSEELGGFQGSLKDVFVLGDKNFKKQAYSLRERKEPLKVLQNHPALDHILNVKKQIRKLESYLQKDSAKKFEIETSTSFGRQIKILLHLISNQHPMSLFKIHLRGFDTHRSQLNTHRKLLKDLDRGLSFLTKYLKELNVWDQTLILTYSEFGRRVKENRSKGTDHGTASVHFATGGLVKPGFYGHEPVLKSTEANLPFHLDFRSLYAVILREQFGLSASQSPLVKNFYKASQSFVKSA